MTSTHPPLTRDDAKTIDQAIQKIIFDDIENLYFFKNYRQVRRFKGTTKSVTPEVIYLFEMKDAVIVHNHPQGTSLSKEDLEAIVQYDAKELIVVTSNHTFTVTRPTNGWNISFDENFKEIFSICSTLADNLLDKEIAKNEFSLFDKETEKLHYIWASLFKFYDIQYKKKRL